MIFIDNNRLVQCKSYKFNTCMQFLVCLFTGDDAFDLRIFMQKPYGHRAIALEERIFNYRLSRARRVVENAFGILSNRFQVLMSTMQHHPSTIRLIVTNNMSSPS